MPNDQGNDCPPIYVLLLRQDDPRKCTAAKLARFRLAQPIYKMKQIRRKCVVLNPFAAKILLNRDRSDALSHGLAVIDCSWEKVQSAFVANLPGIWRRLPTLLASNPTNYAKPHKLSSLEALAASLYIMGFREKASELLSTFKWGPNFLSLNHDPLEAYSVSSNEQELLAAESQFF